MDYKRAASYWTEKQKSSERMPEEELRKAVEDFLLSHNTCALATADLSGRVRCTPIEYTYRDGAFWLLSEGGLKFRGLEENKNVSLAVFDSYGGFGSLGGLQAEGRAEVIEPWSEEYLAFLAYKGLPEERMRKLPVVMHLIKITPLRYDFLSSKLKAQGYPSRQVLVP